MIQYNRLTDHERERISKMLPTGSTFTTIAKSINRSISTVAREVKRNRIGEEYLPSMRMPKRLAGRRIRIVGLKKF